MIVQRLREIQKRHGYLPDAELAQLARATGTPLYRLQEIASFFPHFRQEWNPPPVVEIKVCRDLSCHLAGSSKLLLAQTGLGKLALEGTVEVEGTSCLGRCDRAPAVCISRHVRGDQAAKLGESFHDHVYAGRSAAELLTIARQIIRGEPPPRHSPDLEHPVDRSGWQIDIYRGDPALRDTPYSLVRRYLQSFPQLISAPEEMRHEPTRISEFITARHPWLATLDAAHLQGMGGAGMRAYEKWRDVWAEPPGPKYVVANGDESEPGTFKDRELMLHLPHLIVEGVILAGLIIGATKGFIFIRHEYGEQIERMKAEIERARVEGACGDKLLGTERSFDVEVFESPGGYICGEQSALLEAMEDRRAQPRNRPPELQTNGLYDKPTIVNNVETLAWVPAILHRGGEWFAGAGHENSRGRRLFSISGDVLAPSVFEVESGTTIGALLQLAGGVRGTLKAIATSGPSGGFLPAKLPVKKGVSERLERAVARTRDPVEAKFLQSFAARRLIRDGVDVDSVPIVHLPLDLVFFRSLAAVIGLRDVEMMLGAGIVVYNETRNMLEQARNGTQFFRNESCGKCVPCRIGSQKLVEIGTELLRRRHPESLDLRDADGTPPPIPNLLFENLNDNINDFARHLRLTSICGLGYVAANPLNTVLQFFPEDVHKQAQ